MRPPDSTVCIAQEKRFSNQKNSSVSNWLALHVVAIFPSSQVFRVFEGRIFVFSKVSFRVFEGRFFVLMLASNSFNRMCKWKVDLSCCYGNYFVVIDVMLLLMSLAMLLSMPMVLPVVLPLALDCSGVGKW